MRKACIQSQFGRAGKGEQSQCMCQCREAERSERNKFLKKQAEGKQTQVKICLGCSLN